MKKHSESILPPIVMQVDPLFSSRVLGKYNWTFGSEKRVILQHKLANETRSEVVQQVTLTPQIAIQQTIQPLHLNILMQHLSFTQLPIYKQQLLVSLEESEQGNIQNNKSTQSITDLMVKTSQQHVSLNEGVSHNQVIQDNRLVNIEHKEQTLQRIEIKQKQLNTTTSLLNQMTHYFNENKLITQLKQQSQQQMVTLNTVIQQHKHELYRYALSDTRHLEQHDTIINFLVKGNQVEHVVNKVQVSQHQPKAIVERDKKPLTFVWNERIAPNLSERTTRHITRELITNSNVQLIQSQVERTNMEHTQVSQANHLRNFFHIKKAPSINPIKLTVQQLNQMKLRNIKVNQQNHQMVLDHTTIHQQENQTLIHHTDVTMKQSSDSAASTIVIQNTNLAGTQSTVPLVIQNVQEQVQQQQNQKKQQNVKVKPVLPITEQVNQSMNHSTPFIIKKIKRYERLTTIKTNQLTNMVSLMSTNKSLPLVLKQMEGSNLRTKAPLPFEQQHTTSINRQQMVSTELVQRAQQTLSSKSEINEYTAATLNRQSFSPADAQVRLQVKEERAQVKEAVQQQVKQLQNQLKQMEQQLVQQTEGLKQSNQRINVKQLSNQVYEELSRRLKFEKQRLGR